MPDIGLDLNLVGVCFDEFIRSREEAELTWVGVLVLDHHDPQGRCEDWE